MVVMATNLPPDRNFSELSAAAIRKVHQATDKPVAVMGNIATTISPALAAELRGRGIAVLMGTASGLGRAGASATPPLRAATRRRLPPPCRCPSPRKRS
jgi:hypothetical protein